jgi:hypothetical protein
MNLSDRKPIWLALSNLYLDTELQDYNFKSIATKVKESPYSFEEVKQIDKQEVFPVLYSNLLSVAGVWNGFDEDWLISEITKKLQKRSWFKDFMLKVKYARLKRMYADYWEKLEEAFQKSN